MRWSSRDPALRIVRAVLRPVTSPTTLKTGVPVSRRNTSRARAANALGSSRLATVLARHGQSQPGPTASRLPFAPALAIALAIALPTLGVALGTLFTLATLRIFLAPFRIPTLRLKTSRVGAQFRDISEV